MDIWSYPHPSSFIDEIEYAIRDGENVIVRFPSPPPEGLERELRERLKYSDFQWTSLDASYCGSDPVTFLREQTCPDVSALRVRKIAELAFIQSFQSRWVWIENVRSCDWARWSAALVEYAHACRNVDLLRRTVIVVLISGKVVAEECPEEVALKRLDFRDVVRPADLFVFALWNAPRSISRREHRTLLAHTVAQVAQWDYLLAEELLSLPLDEALSPEKALRQYAQKRGWTAATQKCWNVGTIDGPAGQASVHSALLSVAGGVRRVYQRIWAAQAAVLFPLVEERRIGLVQRYRRYLQPPIETNVRVVNDPLDLEIGELKWYLDRCRKPWALRKRVRRLRHVRNELAHMRPVGPEDALHSVLLKDS